ncbi:hypothetical protein ABLB90_06365 [Photorhabdus bodei]|nr:MULTISPECIES: hypothetical protein [Photorhabdus]
MTKYLGKVARIQITPSELVAKLFATEYVMVMYQPALWDKYGAT